MGKKVDLPPITHDELSEIGLRWLRTRGFTIGFANMRVSKPMEQPDVLAFNLDGISFMLESKVSVSDFLADKKKRHRELDIGVGVYRGYITPAGLLNPSDVPKGWYLLEVSNTPSRRVSVIKGKLRIKDTSSVIGGSKWVTVGGDSDEFPWKNHHNNPKSLASELTLLLGVLHRIQERTGVDLNAFSSHGKAQDVTGFKLD